MTMNTATDSTVATQSIAFERFAGLAGIVTGLSSVLYAVFFLLVTGPLHAYLPSLFLTLGGFLALPLTVALYQRVRAADASFALYALLLATVGYLGTAVHGIYGLSLLLPTQIAGSDTAVFEPDPRGFLAFGVTGVSVFILSWLIARSRAFSRGIAYVGYVLGIALVVLFLGTLFTGNDTNSNFILVPGGFASLLGTPIWSIWLGVSLLAGRRA